MCLSCAAQCDAMRCAKRCASQEAAAHRAASYEITTTAADLSGTHDPQRQHAQPRRFACACVQIRSSEGSNERGGRTAAQPRPPCCLRPPATRAIRALRWRRRRSQRSQRPRSSRARRAAACGAASCHRPRVSLLRSIEPPDRTVNCTVYASLLLLCMCAPLVCPIHACELEQRHAPEVANT